MTTGFFKLASVSAAVALLLAACGGGSDFLAGISGTGITSEGTVTSFASIFVNGVEFTTDNAKIVVNGEPATKADLRVGEVVTIKGTLENKTKGDAKTVVFDRAMYGPIEAIDRGNGVLTALGQTWNVNESTVFVGVTVDELAENDLIAASGFMVGNNTMVATLVQLANESPRVGALFDVESIVSNLNLNAATFNIGRLRIDYRNASLDETAGVLGNGALVEVTGTQGHRGAVFHAESVRVLDRTLGAPGRYVELEGIIAGFNGRNVFSISGQRVNTSAAKQTDDSGLALANGVRVEVEGTIGEHGALIAEKFMIEQPSDIVFTGPIDSVNANAGGFKMFGIPIAVEPATTQYQDLSTMSDRALSLNNLWPGDYASVRAFADKAGRLIATHIQRQDLRVRAEVSGKPDICDASSNILVIAGVTVHAAAATEFTKRNGNHADVTDFCSKLQDFKLVKAEGVKVENAVYASEIRIMD
jgi:hypothetical protein